MPVAIDGSWELAPTASPIPFGVRVTCTVLEPIPPGGPLGSQVNPYGRGAGALRIGAASRGTRIRPKIRKLPMPC